MPYALFFPACGPLGRRWLPLLVVAGCTGTAQSQDFTLKVRIPAANALAVPVASSVQLTFDRPLAPTPATTAMLRAFSSQRGGVLRQDQGATVSVNGPTITLDPTINFRPGETVFTTITHAGPAINHTLPRGQVAQFTTATGGTGRGNFGAGPAASYPVGNFPLRVVLGDVDADGDLDMVVVNAVDDTVSVYFNQGNGTFDPGKTLTYSMPGKPYSVVLGDLDADGDLDMVASGYEGNAVSVRLNQGNGDFGPGAATSYPIAGGPFGVVLGDVNADGALDILTANIFGNSASVLLNKGNGSFEVGNAATYPIGREPESLAVGDIDADDDLDMVVVNPGGNEANVLVNRGDGTFGAGPIIRYPPGSEPTSVALGDVDADGDLDMITIIRSENRVEVRLNPGDGTFGSGPSVHYPMGVQPVRVVLGDVDADGDLDIVVACFGREASGSVCVRLNQGDGTFGSGNAMVYPTDFGPVSVALGDIDNDGDLDIVMVNLATKSVNVFLNQPGTPLTTAAARPAAVSLYPNPARAGQFLRAEGLPANAAVVLRDALGRLVPSVAGTRVPATGPLLLPLPTTLLPGLYLLQAEGRILRVVVE